MNSPQTRPLFGRNNKSGLSLPTMSIYASCLLLLALFFVYKYGSQVAEMGLVADANLPKTHTIECGPEVIYSVISIDRNDNLSFGLGSQNEIQTAAIKNVAAHHGITFTPYQLAELKSLPFLAVDVKQLPQLLSLPYNRRIQASTFATFGRLTEGQLEECIIASRDVARRRFQRPIVISLRVDAEAKTGKMMRIIDALQSNHISRFEYQNQFDESRF